MGCRLGTRGWGGRVACAEDHRAEGMDRGRMMTSLLGFWGVWSLLGMLCEADTTEFVLNSTKFTCLGQPYTVSWAWGSRGVGGKGVTC